MDVREVIVARVLARSGIFRAAHRDDVALELRAHFDDLVDELQAGGLDEREAVQTALERFGGPESIAQGFSRAYRAQRVGFQIAALTVFGLCVVTAVCAFVYLVQDLVVVSLGAHWHSALPRTHMWWEAVVLAGVTLGYLLLYFAEGFFETRPRASAVLLLAGACAVAGILIEPRAPGLGAAVIPAFFMALLMRGVQILCARSVWRVAALAVLFGGLAVAAPRAMGHAAPTYHWLLAAPIGVAVALSGDAMSTLAAAFERRVLRRYCS